MSSRSCSRTSSASESRFGCGEISKSCRHTRRADSRDGTFGTSTETKVAGRPCSKNYQGEGKSSQRKRGRRARVWLAAGGPSWRTAAGRCWRPHGDCDWKAHSDSSTVSYSEESGEVLRKSPRRCWIGGKFRVKFRWQFQALCCCSQSPAEGGDLPTKSHLLHCREEYGGRFQHTNDDPREFTSASISKGMSAGVSDPRPPPLAGGRGLRRPARRSSRRGQSSVLFAARGRRPTFDRSGLMGGGVRDCPRQPTTHGPLSSTCSSLRQRASLFKASRQQMARVVCQQAFRHRHLEREEEETGSKEGALHHCRFVPTPKADPKVKGKGKEKGKGKPSAEGQSDPPATQ